jgi:hypothetical protein
VSSEANATGRPRKLELSAQQYSGSQHHAYCKHCDNQQQFNQAKAFDSVFHYYLCNNTFISESESRGFSREYTQKFLPRRILRNSSD